MAGLYSEDLKRRVREANNIVDVISGAVGKLVRAGRNLKACCPFHNEKTASFNVNAEGQYFNCFGCGKKGDVFTFVMLHERVEFPEAFNILADRAGIRVEVDPKAAAVHKIETDWKSHLYKINDVAAKFFREQLFSDAGKAAREYLKKRGLTEEICEQFRIGYAPPGGSPLLSRLQSMRLPNKAALAAGLASQREEGGQIRDFFYDRLMFPITDIQKRVIAFGGRILGVGEPKYLNTRETPLFSKTKTVYGIDFAKDEIVKSRKAVLVEGYTDVMMCHQFGVTNVVACLGTAITSDHVRQLRRVADELLLMTDSDAAGAKASERSIAVLFTEEMPAKVVRLPGNDKDPCDFLLAHGREPFQAAFEKPTELFEYKFDMVRQHHDILTPMGLKNAADELMGLISTVPSTLLKNQYRYELLKRLNIDERDLRYETRSTSNFTPANDAPANDTGTAPPPANELASAERELLRFLFHEPAWLEQAIGQLDLNAMHGKPEAQIGRALLQGLSDGKLPPDMSVLGDSSAGSIVAREVLERLRDTEDDADNGLIAATQALCVLLAETTPASGKLESALRFEMLMRPVMQATLQQKFQEASRRWTHAKLGKDPAAEQSAYEQVAQLRKQLSAFKSIGGRSLK